MSNESNVPPSDQVGFDEEDDIPAVTNVNQQAAPESGDAGEASTSESTAEASAPVEAEVTAPAETPAAGIGLADDEDEPVGDAQAGEVELLAVITRTGVNPNAELSRDPSSPLDPRHLFREGEVLNIVPCTAAEFNNLVANARRLDPTGAVQGQRWLSSVGQGRLIMPVAETGLDALTRENSLWRQTVRAGDDGSVEIAAGRPKAGERKGNAPLQGEEALQMMQTYLGTGQLSRIPLWHSGIWINLKAPTESQLLELDRRIANEKIELGRQTQGLAYSNSSIYHNSFLFNFALSMVFDCSVSNYTTELLKRKILVTDMPQLLWGLLCTIYPNGYRYHRPCVVDPASCTYVADELLDISKLSWTDNSALDHSQRQHMIRKLSKFTDIELANYVSKHRYVDKGTVPLKDYRGNKTVVELRVPTLADYEASGFSWVEGIVSATDQAFGSQLGDNERNEYMLEQARATALRQYAHWIERIVFTDKNGDQQYIEDRHTLEQLIGQLTGDPTVFENFLNGIQKFINEATISQIAIPSYKCPQCQANQHNPEEAKHPHLIPLDVGTIFFTLLGQRTTLLLANSVI